jgi:hypothetical protein
MLSGGIDEEEESGSAMQKLFADTDEKKRA